MYNKIIFFYLLSSVLCNALNVDRDVIHPRIKYSRDGARKEENLARFWKSKAQEELQRHINREPNTNIAKNVIMFLGDGMSIPTLTAARLLLGDENKQLSFEKFPYTGLSKTYCVNGQTADSACSATAYLCGVKANDGTIGVSANVTRKDCDAMADATNHVSSIAKWAQDDGKSTGIVTTTRVTHASPAGAFAHIADRNWESDSKVKQDGADPKKCFDIAYQLVHQDPGKNFKVIMGGGRKHFLPKDVIDEEGSHGERSDNKNLIKEWQTERNKTGKAEYVWNKGQLNAIDSDKTDYLLGLFESDHCHFHLDVEENNLGNKEPSLADMVSKAIEILSKEKKGFFLFVEGGRIDHAHHFTKPRKALDETLEMAKAVDVALNKTNEKDTLIVVTADHAHTLSMSGYPSRGNDIFGVALNEANDGLPMATLTYANGPSYDAHVGPGGRKNYTEVVNTKNKDYVAPALAPLHFETHGADDVAVFANGPWAHLFTGNYEQNLIPHMMAYAANLNGASNSSVNIGMLTLFIFVLRILF